MKEQARKSCNGGQIPVFGADESMDDDLENLEIYVI